jgi:hypothetical protein
MDIASAKIQYKRLCEEIFKPSPLRYLGVNIMKVLINRPWYKGKVLEKVVKEVVKDMLPVEEKAKSGEETDAALLRPVVDHSGDDCKLYNSFFFIIPSSTVDRIAGSFAP